MNSTAVDTHFESQVGLLWRELRGGLWHSTASHRFRSILESAEILPSPKLAANEFIWARDHGTYCRSIGGVSLFDFAEAEWEDLANQNKSDWQNFLRGPGTDPDTWLSTVWLSVDRSKLTNFVSITEIKQARDLHAGNGSLKWMPGVEACHCGPIPLTACADILVVCAVNCRVFQRIPLGEFDITDLSRLEANWRGLYAEEYEARALSPQERLKRSVCGNGRQS